MTKKLCFIRPSYLPPEQFYQPGDCEEAGWPDVTHIVASAFEGLSAPLSPGMGWLNRFSVFTAGLPPSVHTSICLTRKGGQKSFEFPKQWMNFLSSGWIELQVAQYLFIGVCSVIFHWKMNAKTTVEVYRSLIYPLLLKKNEINESWVTIFHPEQDIFVVPLYKDLIILLKSL